MTDNKMKNSGENLNENKTWFMWVEDPNDSDKTIKLEFGTDPDTGETTLLNVFHP